VSNYNCNHPKGIICTRYSELLRCTPNQIGRVLHERQHPETRAETEDMGFGTIRHSAWQEEAERTGRLPACFGIDAPADYIEHEFATEAFPGVIVHSRPDVVSIQDDRVVVYDYKTVVDGLMGWKKTIDGYRHPAKRRQLQWYSWQLGLHGVPVTHGAYLFEVWDKPRETILRYEVMEFPITFRDMAAVVLWAKKRVSLLQTVLEEESTSR
jgi:hypothetical protein